MARIEWNGGECPVDPDMRVRIWFRDGQSVGGGRACMTYWDHRGHGGDIVAYEELGMAERVTRQ